MCEGYCTECGAAYSGPDATCNCPQQTEGWPTELRVVVWRSQGDGHFLFPVEVREKEEVLDV